MRSIHTIKTSYLPTLIATAGLISILAGCGGREIKAADTVPGTTPTATSAASISLSSIGTQVKSDGSDSLVITATVLDAKNATLPAQALTISSTGGQLSVSGATTDATGKATFSVSGGTVGTNDTITVTVAATGSSATKSIPIQITGSTVALTTAGAATSVAAGTPITISANTKNAGAIGVASQSLRYSIATSSTGSGTLSVSAGTTDGTGTASFDLTGTATGNVDVKVEWLNAAGAVTASATKTIAITAAGGAFMVTAPAASPFAASIGVPQTVTVNVPATIGTSTVASIRYATSLGTWQGNASNVMTVTRTGATDTQTFLTGSNAGNANVQVDALDATGTAITSTSFVFSISAPSNTAASIGLQSNLSVLQPSVGTNLSTATFTAIVKDGAANPNPVGGANVLFELVNSTGTGESISPVIVTTGANGQAQTTYTAGTSPTTQGAGVKATIVGTTISATAPITVGGQATSVSLGASTTIGVNASNTAYTLPVTVIVSDSTGARVSGAVVSLSLWPENYYKGTRDLACKASAFGPFKNEDINSNLILDAGEDIDGPGAPHVLANPNAIPPIAESYGYGAPDGILWPAPSTAGTIPSTVTTGIDGTATFSWTYLKQYANWVDARIRATLQVQGSQATTNIILPLKPLASDISTPCAMPNSPFN